LPILLAALSVVKGRGNTAFENSLIIFVSISRAVVVAGGLGDMSHTAARPRISLTY